MKKRFRRETDGTFTYLFSGDQGKTWRTVDAGKGLRFHEMVKVVRELLSEGEYAAADRSQAQAVAYVWGRQDESGKGARDTLWSGEFGEAYFVHAVNFALGAIGARYNIESAYNSYREFGEIVDYADQRRRREPAVSVPTRAFNI